MDLPFALPRLAGSPDPEGFVEETLRFRVKPRPQPKFKTILDSKALFAGGDGEVEVKTTIQPGAAEGAPVLHLEVAQKISGLEVHDRFTGIKHAGGVKAARLERRMGSSRREEVDFTAGPFHWPQATYPEVLLPFVMRGQRWDQGVRAAYSWTADRFVARVYYESRGEVTVDVPAGTFRAHHVWMYPDLNDWIALGSVVTKLAKPLLPRYDLWFETAAPHRPVRFEGSYGPPGAPEIVLELAG